MNLNVANKSCIRRIGFRHMKSAPARNFIAVLAIALTSVLFTAIFTIAFSVIYSFEQSIAREAGSTSHGTFKAITAEQMDALKEDPLIKEYGIQHFLGIATDKALNKIYTAVSYKDAKEAAYTFCTPSEGRLPKEGTNEAAADVEVLSALDVPVRLGEEFSVSFEVDGVETTETFTLSGYWEADEAVFTHNILLPESRVGEILNKLDTRYENGVDGMYFMSVMFQNASHIEENLITVVENHGYEAGSMVGGPGSATDNAIPIGENWAYLSAQLESGMDFLTAVSMVLILLIIIFTGYLIIYNVFQISVSNDIRFYGLLKTIGTTGKQMKRIVRMQALLLSVIGIPLGLSAGYGIAALILPRVIETTTIRVSVLSVNPLIFLLSALFGLVTVTISCRKPGKMAAKVSPIEAIRYSEGQAPHRKMRRVKTRSSIPDMAFANLGRSKRKTVITILSLSLAVLLLNITITLTSGLDMEKYVSKRCVSDFHLADASYYQPGSYFHESTAVSESVIETIEAQDGIKQGGRTYATTEKDIVTNFITEEYFRERSAWLLSMFGDEEELAAYIESLRNDDGKMKEDVQLYGMEPFCLDKLTVLDGDLSKMYKKGNYIAAVYLDDDYGNPHYDSNWAKVGDIVKIHYSKEKYYDPNTGESIDDIYAIPEDQPIESCIVDSHDAEYEVVAAVIIPNSMTYRYQGYGDTIFILNSETFKKDCGSDSVMYYAFDMEKESIASMEDFITELTDNDGARYDFESREKTIEHFASTRNMYLMAGSSLSLIVGLIGVLNFLNTILTGILTRHREFAVLQSIGMTGKQLKEMLITEGICYALITILFSFILILLTAPFVSSMLESTFWFFSYRFTVLPAVAIMPFFLLLGVSMPLITYRFASGKSIVERLRDAE